MVLHIGGDSVVFVRDIIAIIDKEAAKTSRNTYEFIQSMKKKGRLINDQEDTVSYILTQNEKGERIYCSVISSGTLLRRTGFMQDIAR